MHRSLEIQPLYFIRKTHLEEDLAKLVAIVKRRVRKHHKVTVFDYNGRRLSLFHNDVLYAESFGHRIVLHTTKGELEFRLSFLDFFDKFPDINFLQIHKSYAINVDKVIKLQKQTVLLDKGITLTVGRKYSADLEDKYKQMLFNHN